jgi:hypothetical protein
MRSSTIPCDAKQRQRCALTSAKAALAAPNVRKRAAVGSQSGHPTRAGRLALLVKRHASIESSLHPANAGLTLRTPAKAKSFVNPRPKGKAPMPHTLIHVNNRAGQDVLAHLEQQRLRPGPGSTVDASAILHGPRDRPRPRQGHKRPRGRQRTGLHWGIYNKWPLKNLARKQRELRNRLGRGHGL